MRENAGCHLMAVIRTLASAQRTVAPTRRSDLERGGGDASRSFLPDSRRRISPNAHSRYPSSLPSGPGPADPSVLSVGSSKMEIVAPDKTQGPDPARPGPCGTDEVHAGVHPY